MRLHAKRTMIDPDDGSLKWHYQWTPHDGWDYDGVNENILFERTRGSALLVFALP